MSARPSGKDFVEVIHAKQRRLSALPCETDHRCRLRSNILADILLQYFVRKSPTGRLRIAWIEPLLFEIEAVLAGEIA